jgi:tetratricopeptide (TPR) repeat protein
MRAFWTDLMTAAIAAASIAQAAAAAEPAERETITIRGETYSVARDDELRAFGIEYPDVAPEENAATYYLRAMEVYEKPAPRSELERLRDEVMGDRWTDASGPLTQYLEDNEEAFRLIEEAAAREPCRFPVLLPAGAPLETPVLVGMSLPQLARMREFARFVVTEGKARESKARYEDALDAYLVALRMGNHTAQEPFLINGLVGIACNAIGLKAIEQSLVRYELDEKTLAIAQLRVHELSKQRPSIVTAMRGERALGANTVEWLIEHLEKAESFLGGSGIGQAALSLMLRSKEGQEQMRRDVRVFWNEMDEALQLPLAEFIETGAGDEPIRKAQARKIPPNIMGMLGPALRHARTVYGRNELYWTVLDVEFALARYAAEHGMYPQTLDELRPLMLTDGIDPFSGKPLHYRLEADGAYTIWSVGRNLVDDGGQIGTQHTPSRDEADHVWNSGLIAGAD